MKTLKNILSLTLILAFALSCKNEAKPEVKTIEVETTTAVNTKKLDPNATYAKAEFTIDGMTCAVGCAATIQKKLGKMDGVKSAVVDFDKRLAMVEYNEATVTPSSLTETVTKVADIYKVKDMKTVEAFSTEKKEEAKVDCPKACCKDKKTACKADCKKEGCVSNKEAA
ncbi:hypothetical protein GCM10022291_16260 [Postechiella marina]|uniref:HMA domain-containing protein n=1 Tax=Postechiella marina TaxID=943941 RepID=A0ABP8C7L5_9FLAO